MDGQGRVRWEAAKGGAEDDRAGTSGPKSVVGELDDRLRKDARLSSRIRSFSLEKYTSRAAPVTTKIPAAL